MPAPGDRHDRFQIEEVLGQGGMATVYRVRHLGLGSLHALKVLDLPLPSVRARLVQEGQLQARLRHPNIVAVTDLIDVEGAPGLVMEFVGGPSLDTWLHTNRADPGTATALFDGILDAVAFAHRAGLVHRDLKPGNVLLHFVDGRVVAKVTDFGLAKLLSGAGPDHHTRTGFAMGTPGYMAPEQVRNAKDVDARTDVFALGCILYELWCGTPAFPSRDVFQTLDAMEKRRWVDPRAQRPDIPPEVVEAIVGALEPDRERRLASCEAMRAVLRPTPARAGVPAAIQAGWEGGEGIASAVSMAPAPVARPEPPPPPPAATFDPSLPPASLFEPRPTGRATTMGAAAGVGAVMVSGALSVAICAGVGWFALGLGAPEDPPSAAAPPTAEPTPATTPVSPPPSTAPTVAAAPASPPRPAAPSSPRPGAAPAASPTPLPAPAGSTPAAPPEAPSTSPAAPSPAAAAPAPAAPASAAPTEPSAAAPGRFEVSGTVDAAWLEAGGRRFGVGVVPAGSYTLHARWGTTEVERKVRVEAGRTLTAACDATFVNCAVR